ncbi:hypothetical protein L7F22_057324 [Adiantum nelumboides]|nr:hypothetical protein [Adiantum nelumboides]
MVAKSGKTGDSASAPRSSSAQRFKGVRMRSWGKWVSEIRLPNTRARLWLGSFATAEQAARAFDVALVCLRGRSVALNFPHSPPAYAPLGLPLHQIQELAAAASASAAPIHSVRSAMSTQIESAQSDSAQSESAKSDSIQSESAFSDSTQPVPNQSAPATSTSSSPCSAAYPAASSPSWDQLATATVSDTCSSTWLNLEDRESSPSLGLPLEYCWEEEQLGVQWDELLWGSCLSSYDAWDQQLLKFPLLPPDEDMVEPCLWNL